MPWPLVIRGEFAVEPKDAERTSADVAVGRIEAALERSYSVRTSRSAGHLAFEILFGQPRSMAPIGLRPRPSFPASAVDSGDVTVTESEAGLRVAYDLRARPSFIIIVSIPIAAVAWVIGTVFSPTIAAIPIVVFVVATLILLGIDRRRFPVLMRRAILGELPMGPTDTMI